MHLIFPDDPAVADAIAHRLAAQMAQIMRVLEHHPGAFKLVSPTWDGRWRAEIEFETVPAPLLMNGVGLNPGEAVDNLIVDLSLRGMLP